MSCSCSDSGSSFSEPEVKIINSLNKRVVADPVYISKSKFANADKLSLLQFAHCSDTKAFVKAFGPNFKDSNFTPSDLQKLADLWETGKDKENGFSVERMFGSISTNLNTLDRCSSIKWTS